GVGVFAGGPYYCVGINPTRAESICMQGSPAASGSIGDAERLGTLQLNDPTDHLRRTRAWLLAGDADQKVRLSVVRSNQEFFAHYNAARAELNVQSWVRHSVVTNTT